jgi:hypothetical protein
VSLPICTRALHISFIGKAFRQSIFAIQSEQINGRAPLPGQADNPFSFVSEVLLPSLRPRVEQRAELSGLWVEGGEVAPFVAIATSASERQVIYISRTIVLLRYYVIALMREECNLGREQQYSRRFRARSRISRRSAVGM